MKNNRNQFRVDFGVKLKKIREEKGFSRPELCTILNCNRAYLSNVEAGNRMPSFNKIYIICTVLRCEITDLLPKVKDIKPNDFNCA